MATTGKYVKLSRKSVPSSASWMYISADRSTVKLDSEGDAWIFTVTISVNNDYRLNVTNWNNSATSAKYSKMNVILREGSASGKVIGSASVKFKNTPMVGVDLKKTMATVTVKDIKGTAERIYVTIHADLRGVYGTNGKAGVYYVSKNINITDLYEYGYFDVSEIPLTSKPVLGKISNTNKYNNQAGVSASNNSISIKWELTDGDPPTAAQYRLNSGSWVKLSNLYSATITGLKAYTSYKIEVRGSNDAGNSNIISITIRTLSNPPTASLVLTDALLEDLNYKWTANLKCSNIEYKYIIENSSEISVEKEISSLTTGSITIDNIPPNTLTKVAIRVKSISSYDGLWSEYTDYVEGTTDKIAELTSQTDMIFGDNFIITKINPSGNPNRVEIEVGDLYINVYTKSSAPNSINAIPTDSQLDKMYMQYKNSNTIPIRYKVITIGKSKEYVHVSDGILILTGNMKTSHIGIDDKPQRSKVWIGDKNNVPRRCVVWVGDENNIPRRCI